MSSSEAVQQTARSEGPAPNNLQVDGGRGRGQRRRGPDTPSKLRFKDWLYWGRIMTRRAFNPFTCPNCKALYQVVKVEAGLETPDREITCQVCRGPLAGQEAKFVLKYFLLREGIRTQRRWGQSQVISSSSSRSSYWWKRRLARGDLVLSLQLRISFLSTREARRAPGRNCR